MGAKKIYPFLQRHDKGMFKTQNNTQDKQLTKTDEAKQTKMLKIFLELLLPFASSSTMLTLVHFTN